MTNEYKLAPKVPTDEMHKSGTQALNDSGVDFVENRDALLTYTAMLKDAPTVVEVDLAEIVSRTMIEAINYKEPLHTEFTVNRCVKDITEMLNRKYGKIYAVKGE